MAWFFLGGGWIVRKAFSKVAVAGIGAGMFRRPVVRVDDMASRAAAAAIVAGFVVGAWQRKHGIEQARFLQAEEYRIRAEQSAETAFPQFVIGAAGFFLAIQITD